MSPVETTRPAAAPAVAELTPCQQRLEKTKQDARGERTNHGGAATFWTVIYLLLGLAVIALTAAAGATGVAADNAQLAGWLAFAAAVLSGFIGLLRPQQRAAHDRRLKLGYETVLTYCENRLLESAHLTEEHVCAAATRAERQFTKLHEDEIRDDVPLGELPI